MTQREIKAYKYYRGTNFSTKALSALKAVREDLKWERYYKQGGRVIRYTNNLTHRGAWD